MNPFFDLAKDITALIRAQPDIYAKVFNKNEFVFSDAIADQMERGRTGFGTPITPEYSPGYAAFKGFSTPNLRLEGDFHKSIIAKADRSGVLIDATDIKKEMLIEKYGEEILLPEVQTIDDFNLYIEDDLMNENESRMKKWL